MPNESKRHVLYLKGYGHDEQMYLACPGKEVAQPDSLEDFNSLPASEFDAGVEAAEAMGLAKRLVQNSCQVRPGHERTTSLFVGCCAATRRTSPRQPVDAVGQRGARDRGSTTSEVGGLFWRLPI